MATKTIHHEEHKDDLPRASPDDYPLSFDEVLSADRGLVKAGNPAFDTIVMKQLKAVAPRRD